MDDPESSSLLSGFPPTRLLQNDGKLSFRGADGLRGILKHGDVKRNKISPGACPERKDKIPRFACLPAGRLGMTLSEGFEMTLKTLYCNSLLCGNDSKRLNDEKIGF